MLPLSSLPFWIGALAAGNQIKWIHWVSVDYNVNSKYFLFKIIHLYPRDNQSVEAWC